MQGPSSSRRPGASVSEDDERGSPALQADAPRRCPAPATAAAVVARLRWPSRARRRRARIRRGDAAEPPVDGGAGAHRGSPPGHWRWPACDPDASRPRRRCGRFGPVVQVVADARGSAKACSRSMRGAAALLVPLGFLSAVWAHRGMAAPGGLAFGVLCVLPCIGVVSVADATGRLLARSGRTCIQRPTAGLDGAT
jgi:hypothetical protein